MLTMRATAAGRHQTGATHPDRHRTAPNPTPSCRHDGHGAGQALGIGLAWHPALDPLCEASEGLVDVIEAGPAACWAEAASHPPRALLREATAHLAQPVILHDAMPLGGTLPADSAQASRFRQDCDSLRPPLITAVLGFNRFQTLPAAALNPPARAGFPCSATESAGVSQIGTLQTSALHTGPLQTNTIQTGAPQTAAEIYAQIPMPLRQSAAGARFAAQAILRRRAALGGVRIAVALPANPLPLAPGECQDGAFLASVAHLADSGIALDLTAILHNVEAGRQEAEACLAALPPERIWTLHLGSLPLPGATRSASQVRMTEAALALAAALVPRLPALQAIILRPPPDAKGPEALRETRACLLRLRHIWSARGQASAPSALPHRAAAPGHPPPQASAPAPAKAAAHPAGANNPSPATHPAPLPLAEAPPPPLAAPANSRLPARTPAPDTRAPFATAHPDHGSQADTRELRHWEALLGFAATGHGAPAIPGPWQVWWDSAAPQAALYRRAARAARASAVAGCAPNTARCLMASYGASRARHMLELFWRSTPPAPAPLEEARRFADFLAINATMPVPMARAIAADAFGWAAMEQGETAA